MSDPAVSAAERRAGVDDGDCPACEDVHYDGSHCWECGHDLETEKDEADYAAWEANQDER